MTVPPLPADQTAASAALHYYARVSVSLYTVCVFSHASTTQRCGCCMLLYRTVLPDTPHAISR